MKPYLSALALWALIGWYAAPKWDEYDDKSLLKKFAYGPINWIGALIRWLPPFLERKRFERHFNLSWFASQDFLDKMVKDKMVATATDLEKAICKVETERSTDRGFVKRSSRRAEVRLQRRWHEGRRLASLKGIEIPVGHLSYAIQQEPPVELDSRRTS